MTRLCVASDLGRMLLIPMVTPGAAGASPRGDEAGWPVELSVQRRVMHWATVSAAPRSRGHWRRTLQAPGRRTGFLAAAAQVEQADEALDDQDQADQAAGAVQHCAAVAQDPARHAA